MITEKTLSWQPLHALSLASLKTTCHGNKAGKIEKHHICTFHNFHLAENPA